MRTTSNFSVKESESAGYLHYLKLSLSPKEYERAKSRYIQKIYFPSATAHDEDISWRDYAKIVKNT